MKTLEQNNVWVIIPAYNEEQKIVAVVNQVLEYTPNVVVIDDGSRDNTLAEAKRTNAWVLGHCINRGQGAAIRTGIEFALGKGAEIIVTFDSDGQHDVTEISKMVQPIVEGQTAAVLGSRFLEGSHNAPLVRRVILQGGVVFTRVVSRIDVTDTHNGFRALSRPAAKMIEINQDRMTHASEILDQISKKKISYTEVPVTIRYSDETLASGQSSWNAISIVTRIIISKIF